MAGLIGLRWLRSSGLDDLRTQSTALGKRRGRQDRIPMSELSHFDESGKIKMVDVSEKGTTARRAVASGKVILSRQTLETLQTQRTPKGDPLEIARIAGIMAAKRTSELIPLCHQINLSKVNVTAEVRDFGIYL